MFLIFNQDRVFRLCVPSEEVLEEVKKDGELAIEVENFMVPNMPVLQKDEETGEDIVSWVSRNEFDILRTPPAETAEEPEGDVDMV